MNTQRLQLIDSQDASHTCERVVRTGHRQGTIVLFPESAVRQPLEWSAPLWIWAVVVIGEIVLSIVVA